MADMYENFSKLSIVEKKNVDYKIVVRDIGSSLVVMAPHGGGIEPGTSEIVRSIAGDVYSYYCFEGIKDKENRKFLHITSTRFDDPECDALCRKSKLIVTIHGSDDTSDIVYVGGLNRHLKNIMIEELRLSGFDAKEDITAKHSGTNIRNLCNRGSAEDGLQLEISNGLRRKMFKGLSSKDRIHTTQLYDVFVKSIQSALVKY